MDGLAHSIGMGILGFAFLWVFFWILDKTGVFSYFDKKKLERTKEQQERWTQFWVIFWFIGWLPVLLVFVLISKLM